MQHWSRDEKNRCLREAAKSFRMSGQIVRLIILWSSVCLLSWMENWRTQKQSSHLTHLQDCFCKIELLLMTLCSCWISVQPLTRMPQIQFLGRILSFVILEAYIYERWKVMNIICSYLSITSSFLSKWGSYFASFAIKIFLTNVFWPWFCQAGWSYFCRRIVSKAKIW